MNTSDSAGGREVKHALSELRARTATSLQAFNDAVPYTSWLRRSEIERFTSELMRAAETAPRRRRLAWPNRIPDVIAWFVRITGRLGCRESA